MRKLFVWLMVFAICLGLLPIQPVMAKSLLDIVFIIDRSGSMGDDIINVRDNINRFTDKLEQQGFDYRLGLVTYETSSQQYDLTSDVNTFRNYLSGIYVDGGTENGLDAIMDAINNYTYELQSYKYFVLIGDEEITSSRGYTLNFVRNELKNHDITLTAVGVSNIRSQFEQLSSYTGGLYLDLNSGFSTNLEHIFDQIQQLPIVEILAPQPNQIFTQKDTAFVPSVRVTDPDSDWLDVSYKFDMDSAPRESKRVTNTKSAQIVNFNSFNMSSLPDGERRIIFTVNDGSDTVLDSLGFTVDKTAPQLSNVNAVSTEQSITISGSATDSTTGLANQPYRYRLGSNTSSWMTNSQYTFQNLQPNTSYTVTIEARDKAGNTASSARTLYTKAAVPTFTISEVKESSLKLVFSDRNPVSTEVQIKVGTSYAGGDGKLVSQATWVPLQQKTISLQDLTPNQTYSIQVKARNKEGIETSYSQLVNATTLAIPPAEISYRADQTSIRLEWASVPNIIRYDLEVDGQIVSNGTANSYIHSGLNPNTKHTYRVRVVNQGGAGAWSELLTVYTLPDPPPVPTFTGFVPKQTEITLSWDAVPRATAYDIELNGGQIVELGAVTSYVHRYLSADTEYRYRIRAKNSGGTSEWSPVTVVRTLPYPPETPASLSARLSIYSVEVEWSPSERATSYELEVDGLIVAVGDQTKYIHDGLEPVSGHTYRVRAVNAGGKSAWSEPLDITTHPEKPVVPTNIITTSDTASITLTWQKVPHAERYEIEIEGTKIVSVDEPILIHEDLNADTMYQYRLRAYNISGYSEWSEPVRMMTLPEGTSHEQLALTNMAAIVTNHFITLSWETVARDAEYEIEVDGVLEDIGSDTVYHHGGLKPNEYHFYKIRLKQQDGSEGRWVAILSLSTLPDPPDAPKEIVAYPDHTSMEIRWEKIEGATGYDIEIDGVTVSAGNNTRYKHEGLEPGTSHTYRVRAKNITGVTAWSPAVTRSTTTPLYELSVTKDVPVNLTILANHVQDFSEMEFVVSYDPDQLVLVDAYDFTPRRDTATGAIPESNLYVTVSTGEIRFVVRHNIVPGTSWSGEISTLVFMPKISGQATISVVVE